MIHLSIENLRGANVLALLFGGLLLNGCGKGPAETRETSVTGGSVQVRGEVWADNWFAFYLGDEFVIEDSVPITTERSFNSESFVFSGDYPLVLNFLVKDFKQNDSGLEYIGSRRQQIGDGGLIAQFTDAETGELIAATNSDWKCYVLHEAPLDPNCAGQRNPQAGVGPCGFLEREEPAGWKRASFDDSSWQSVSEFSEREVRPKDGYDRIQWDRSAKLIWSSDLKLHNTVLCRLVINKP
ncbi:PEBP family protein [bacterium]|jgi:hypothetical protein|nr:PEBP family protein [Verrucomicrobiota bacterium]MDA7510280.1 PEBP family protein [Verrucomicrobiota bacterium]MDA7633164.1 PEBP family protein [bacterium]